ncbi:MAG: PLP-dependent aspartate aminotransferase family protein [Hyphomicrobiaceae bacterium]
MSKDLKPETIAAQAGGVIDETTGAIVPPIHLATTFIRDSDNQYRRGFVYARPDTPIVRQTEDVIRQLEGGETCMLLGSGMAAATAAFLALPRPCHVVAPNVMYWALRKWLIEDAPTFGIRATFVDATSLDAVQAAVVPGETRMIWIETPANPTWGVSDIRGCARIAHAAGALLGVDSTTATPVLTRPLALGADVVMHSATKYLNGHSDVIAGALIVPRKDAYSDQIARVRSMLGAVLAPFEASLLLRGLRTLHVRVRQQCETAMAVAQHFAREPRIAEVLYPGLPDQASHAVARAQMTGGFGGMLSVRVKAGEAAAIRTAANVKLWKRATSLGGVESLIEHRASIEGPGTPCPADLLRLSVGLEAAEDLIADLSQALTANA